MSPSLTKYQSELRPQLDFFFKDKKVNLSIKKNYCGNKKWTLWERFDIDGRKSDGDEMTVGELIDYFKIDHKLELEMLSSGDNLLYSFFFLQAEKNERMAMRISEAVKQVGNRDLGDHEKYLILDICVNEEDQEMPYVRYRFRN